MAAYELARLGDVEGIVAVVEDPEVDEALREEAGARRSRRRGRSLERNGPVTNRRRGLERRPGVRLGSAGRAVGRQRP